MNIICNILVMPETYSKFSIDYYLYPIRNKISKHLCFINPNFVTLLGIVMVVPLLYNIYHDRSILEFIILFMIIYELDGYDGSIARTCDKVTKNGALLDVLTDTIKVILISIMYIYKLNGKINSIYLFLIKIISLFSVSIFIKSTLNELFSKKIRYNDKDYYKENYLEYIGNSYGYIFIIYVVVLKYVLIKC